jgi:FkbM family methyltransferase
MLKRGELARAIAIEPEPYNFSLLEHNVKQNGLNERILCLPYAASHQKAELRFELSASNYGDHRIRLDVPLQKSDERFDESKRRVMTVSCDTLDKLLGNVPEYFSSSIGILWVDVQGHEGYAFMGARNLLSKGIPVVSEIWPYGIRRAGMSQDEFCNIAESNWSSYWVSRKGRFVRYPTSILCAFFEELGPDGFQNVVFTP